MRCAGLLPEPCLLTPIRFASGTHRHPDLDPHTGGIAAGFLGQAAQLAENVESTLVRAIGIRHPAVAPLGDARKSALVMPAEPHRHLARGGQRVDAGVLDRVPAALE